MTPRMEVRSVGAEARPLVVIDDFAGDPDALRAAAAGMRFGAAGQHYPGLRAALPDDYLERQRPVIDGALRDVFGLGSARVVDASFSIVTTPPAALSAKQRLPHCDAFAPGRIALIHYLVPGGGDGTAFYRHRSTGYETIDEARAPAYFEKLAAELRDGAPPRSYIAGDTALFERTMAVEARYNRALLYPSYLLHSGAIAADAVLSPSPVTGRLTVTGFFSAELLGSSA